MAKSETMRVYCPSNPKCNGHHLTQAQRDAERAAGRPYVYTRGMPPPPKRKVTG